MRVLKPNGKMVVSEENTPRDAEYIERELKSAGFIIEASQYMSKKPWDETPEDDKYRATRNLFYTAKPDGAYGGYFGTPNIVVGVKPEDIEFETRMLDVTTNFYEERDSIDDWNVRQLPFKFPMRK